jgi:DNA-binding NtrC family response regulator
MAAKDKRILIIDEQGFSRICSAILNRSGYDTDIVIHGRDLSAMLDRGTVSLVVTSYPYGASHFDALRKRDIPTIILSDALDERLISLLGSLRNSCCMIKPVDYDKFKNMVKQVFDGSITFRGGYSIV